MKVPIDVEDEKNDAVEPEVEPEGAQSGAPTADAAESGSADAAEADGEELSPEEERARVEAAIRAGEEAAERELAADASAVRNERDELQKKLAEAEEGLAAAKKEASEATERLVRLQADWENYRRRTAAERLAEKERAAEKLVLSLLPVIDDLERAVEHAGATEGDAQMQQFVDGVSAVHAKMVDVLSKEGVEPIDPAGEPFDPLEHQAVGRVDDTSVYDETVAQVYQKGYRMGSKVIRSAMVTVAYGGPKRPVEEASEEAAETGAGDAGQSADAAGAEADQQ